MRFPVFSPAPDPPSTNAKKKKKNKKKQQNMGAKQDLDLLSQVPSLCRQP